MTSQEKRHQTQWTAQFLAAAELSRRGYAVGFTMGNHTPVADLMVGSSAAHFWVDVKGLATNNAWHLRPKTAMEDLYYVLVRVASIEEPRKSRQDRFFLLSQKSANDLVARYQREHPKDRQLAPGLTWPYALDFEDCWDCLPAPR